MAIKVVNEKLMSSFTSALAFAIYPNIYVRKGWENSTWLIEHEKLHIKEQKEKGVIKWLYCYATDKDFRYWAEIRAYKVSVSHGLHPSKAARWIADDYRLDIPREQILKDLAE
jgi:hypothetical protein